MALDNSGLTGN